MAEEGNAAEHQDRGLFGMFGKKKEEETHQQGHVAGVAPHGQGHVGEVHPAPVSHGHVEEGKFHGEGEKKKHQGKLHRSNSSSSSSSSDEEEDEKGEKKKKKGGLKDKIKLPGRHEKKEGDHPEEQGEKKGLMDKIKEKLPGHHKDEEKGH